MKQFYVLTLIGPDRTGIVDEVTGILFAHGGNIEKSHMAVLGGCFTIMALFSCERETASQIDADLKGLRKNGFTIALHPAGDAQDKGEKQGPPLSIEINAMDHPGIVQEIVHVLYTYDVNIRSLNTKITNAPHSGVPLFYLELLGSIAVDDRLTEMEAQIQALARAKDLDLKLRFERLPEII